MPLVGRCEELQPSVELPARPFGHGRGSEPAFVPPQPHEMLTVLGLGLDRDAGAGKTAIVEPFLQLVGQGLGDERGVIDTLSGRIELGQDREIGRDGTFVEQPPLAPVGEPMRERAERPEASSDI